MAAIERDLVALNLFTENNGDKKYFIERGNIYGIGDDHKPFEQKGL